MCIQEKNKIQHLYDMLHEIERKSHAMKILNYDMETASPEGGMQDDSEDLTFFSGEIFRIVKSQDFQDTVRDLYENDYETLNPFQKKLVRDLYKDQQKQKNLTPELQEESNRLYTNAYITWIKAKNDNSYPEFKDTLKNIAAMDKKLLLLRETTNPDKLYEARFDDFEEGFTEKDLDTFFDELEKGIVPLIKKVRKATYIPRHDFLNRKVSIAKQEEFTKFLLAFNGFDFKRGSVGTTEHPFTEQFGKDDVRVTTKYIETAFISNMYSVIHEGGHAIFGQNIPEEVFTNHLGEGCLSMAKHESVSRFYENIIGRSREYVHAIYPDFQKLFKEEMGDVSEEDLYEGVNYVDLDNPLRTEADELTYSLHIIIRYRLEKEMLEGKCDFDHLNERWNELYKELLGIENKDDKTGILQDVHWTSGFGYFPTYAMGNALNCIYVKAMDQDIDVKKQVSEGHMDVILSWMKEHVFKTAPIEDTKTWIKNITGEEFSPKPYIDYLTDKFTALYHLDDEERPAIKDVCIKKKQDAIEKSRKNGLKLK